MDAITDTVIDSTRNLVVMTGTTTDFYPTYNADDPYASMDRGYYFHGASIMQLPPND